MKRKVVCYVIGIFLIAWFIFAITNIGIGIVTLWRAGILGSFPIPYASIGFRLPLLAVGILLIWVAHKKIKTRTKEAKTEG